MRRGLLLVCAAAFLCNCVAMAAEVGYSCDNDNGNVVISGVLDNGKERVSLQIYNKAKFNTYAADGAVNETNIDDVLVYSAQGYTDDNGLFSFSFPLKEASGAFIARIGTMTMASGLDYGFYYTRAEEEPDIIRELKNMKNAADLMEYVEGDETRTIDMFNPDAAYDGIENKIAIYQRLVNNAEYNTLSDFSASFAKETRLQVINEITDGDNLIQKIGEYNSETGIADAPFYNETYVNILTDEQKKKVLSDVVNHSDFNSFEELYRYIGGEIILSAVGNNDWNVVKTVMQTNEEFFREDVKDKFSESDLKREKAAKTVAGKMFKSFEALESEIERAFENKNTNVDTGSGGGGGGSISSGKGVSTAPVQPIATPIPMAQQKMPFKDLDGFDWAEQAVDSLWKRNVINGTSEDMFEPSRAVTREEFVAMIVRNFELLDKRAECEFTDISKDDWCYGAVASAYKLGIILGVDDETFGKGTEITRQDMCVIIYRAAENAGVEFKEEAELPFDDKISDYAEEQIKVFYANGIISGLSETEFGAFERSNRAQAATVIHRINEYMNKEE